MNVKNLIKHLLEFNMEANVDVIVDSYPKEWSICFGGYDGCTKENCDSVSFYVESPNSQEREG